MTPTFHAADGAGELTVIDPIQRRRCSLRTSTAVTPRDADTEQFHFPVGSAAEITTAKLVLPYVVTMYVRDTAGEMVREAQHFAYETLPEDEYVVELMGPIKLYVRVESELSIASSTDRMEVDFGGETDVRIGARSYHERPEATVVSTGAPRDLMAAVSTFGSALKTTSCERSFPTLRGHPPRIELGEELSIPDSLTRPDTGVRIELPPDRGTIYAAAPLAYYLGAAVVPGDAPRIVTETGFEHRLDTARGVEGELERVLKQTFFLDCLTRTEGYYQVDLHERNQVGSATDLAFGELYDAPLADRIAAHLDVPFEVVEDEIPRWRLATVATGDVSNAELLPYVAHDLSLVRTAPSDTERETPTTAPVDVEEFARSSTFDRAVEDGDDPQYVTLPDTAALERVWLGDGKPLEGGKPTKQAFENKLERETSSGGIDITIVCNDPEMGAEVDSTERELYGDRDELPFDVTLRRELSVAELRDVLGTETEFLHYIGHIETDGFVCRDGALDAATLDSAGADTFLLNGCKSYEQGERLIDAGSVGGIVTLSDVGNRGATAVGRLVGRLLNQGFSLRSALGIARDQRIVGNQYIVLGDGGSAVVQNESGTPLVCHVESLDTGEYEMRLVTYPTVEQGMGSMFIPHLGGVQSQFLNGGELPPFTVSTDVLAQFLRLERAPVIVENELIWSTDIELDDW